MSLFAFIAGLLLGFLSGLLVAHSDELRVLWRRVRAPGDDGTADRGG